MRTCVNAGLSADVSPTARSNRRRVVPALSSTLLALHHVIRCLNKRPGFASSVAARSCVVRRQSAPRTLSGGWSSHAFGAVPGDAASTLRARPLNQRVRSAEQASSTSDIHQHKRLRARWHSAIPRGCRFSRSQTCPKRASTPEFQSTAAFLGSVVFAQHATGRRANSDHPCQLAWSRWPPRSRAAVAKDRLRSPDVAKDGTRPPSAATRAASARPGACGTTLIARVASRCGAHGRDGPQSRPMRLATELVRCTSSHGQPAPHQLEGGDVESAPGSCLQDHRRE